MTTKQIWKYKPKNEDRLGTLVEKDNDIVMTNPEMAKHLISTISFQDGDIVCDPCKGKGAFYNNFPDNVKKIYFEINEGKDYLTPECEMVDITISNPPFIPRKLFWDFHVKAMDTTRRNIYWLVNITSINVFTPKRLDEMKEKNWYMEHLHIVSDKRWFGRYALICFGKDAEKNILSFNRNSF
jgi:hypothetical protein